MKAILLSALAIVSVGAVRSEDGARSEPCCNVVALDARTRTVTAIDRASAKLFSFTVTSPTTFRNIRLADHFDAPLATMKKGMVFAADIGRVRNPGEPCCNLTAALGEAGQALGVRSHDANGVLVVLLELKRTAGNTLTAKWQYLNGSDQALEFEPKGCVGMGCTYTLAEDVQFLDGATRTKFPVLRDTENQAVAQRYEASKLSVGAHQILNTWAKFNEPPVSSSRVTFMIPGVSEPFEDVPIGP
jgi:hypothetical protein